MFPWKLAERLLHTVARRPGNLADVIFHLSEMYQFAYKNVSYEFAINGEFWLLDRLKHSSVEMVFDVGTNHGEWSTAAAARFPNAVIHAFEIVPLTYNYLEGAARKTSRIRPNPFGLSDRAGFVDVNVWEKNDTVSSMLGLGGIREYPYPTRVGIATVT
jgi:hypothetical protein